MASFQRILFPVDFSAQSRAVIPCVQAMAQRFNSQVIVMHVISLPPAWFGPAQPESWAVLINADRIRAEARIGLDRFVSQEMADMPVTVELAEGDVARQIVDYAEEDKADLIMMPTHGYGPFRSLLLGSITAKVLHDSRCPVWTGVHAAEMNAHSPGRWKRMLCAIDADPKAAPLLQWAADFAAKQKMELRLVHAVAGADGATKANDPGMYEFLFHVAREQIAKLQSDAGTRLDLCLLGGAIGHAVHQAAIGHEADLIVIGRGVIQKPFGRLRSSAYSIVREAPCPVISI